MKYYVPIAGAVIVALAIGGYVYTHEDAEAPSDQTVQMPSVNSTVPVLPDEYVIPGQRKYYKNDEHSYVFEVPKDLYVEEYGVGTQEPEVLLRNKGGDKLILLRMTPVDPSLTTVTTELLQQYNGQSKVTSEPQAIMVDGVQGLTFDSEGETWGVGHRIWFVKEGTLYRFSTRKDLFPIEKAIRLTFRFTK